MKLIKLIKQCPECGCRNTLRVIRGTKENTIPKTLYCSDCNQEISNPVFYKNVLNWAKGKKTNPNIIFFVLN